MNGIQRFILNAAQKSRGDHYLWKRYLNKIIHENRSDLTQHDILVLTSVKILTPYQMQYLKRALVSGSDEQKEVVGVSSPETNFEDLKNVLKQVQQ